MSDPFVHLRVASGYSLRYGASAPSALVAAAAGHEMDTLAITDRDGLYGAVRFAKACAAAGIAPVVGVDFAVAPVAAARPRSARAVTPAKGGELRDARLPRVVTLATSRAGWASLCRLTTAVHAAGERGEPVCTTSLVAANGRDLLVMLGPDSELGLALAAGRPDVAEQVLAGWLEVVEPHQLVLAVANQQLGRHRRRHGCARRKDAGLRRRPPPGRRAHQRGADGGQAPRPHPRRAGRLAPAGAAGGPQRRPPQRGGLPEGGQGDAAAGRGGVPAGRADRRGAAARRHPRGRDPLPARPARRHRPRRDPPARVRRAQGLRHRCPRRAAAALPGRAGRPLPRSRPGRARPAGGRARRDRRPRVRPLLPHRRRHHRPGARPRRPLRRPRLGCRQPRELPARHLRRRPDPARPADGAVPLAVAGRRCPTSTSTWSRRAARRCTT